MANVTMSLNQIRAFSPCETGWKTLLKALNKTAADDEPIPLEFIVESNGIRDAIWCMRVNWFEYKELYMEFVGGCVSRTKEYGIAAYAANAAAYAAAAYAANAYDADDADVADAAADAACAAADAAADAAAYAAAAYAAAAYAAAAYADAAYAAERQKQKEHLLQLLAE